MDSRLKQLIRRRELLRGLVLFFAVTKVQVSHAKPDAGFVDMTPESDEEDEKEKAEQEKADQALDAENHPAEDDSDPEPASEGDSDDDKKDDGE